MVKNIIIAMLLVALLYSGYRWKTCEDTALIPVEQPVKVEESRTSNEFPSTDTSVSTIRDTASILIPAAVVPNSSDTTKEYKKPKRNLWQKVTGRKENVHVVRKGDPNLYRIAEMYNTTWPKLMELNPQITNPNKIYVGQEIYIGTVEERYVPPTADNTDSTYYYEEYYGNDTLNAIVKTTSTGPLIQQDVELNYKPSYIEIKRGILYAGGGFGSDLSAGAGVAYKTKQDRLFMVEYRMSPYSPQSINVRAYIPFQLTK